MSLLGLAGGIGMPMQTSINAQLGKRVGSPFIAALINFFVGLVVLLIITMIWEHNLRIPVDAIAAAPPWILFGGAFAVVFVTGNVLLMPRLGTVQKVILPALGQIIMGTLIDTFGWFESAQKAMSPLRILGVALVFCDVIVVMMIGGLLVDQFGMFRSTRRVVGWKEIAGIRKNRGVVIDGLREDTFTLTAEIVEVIEKPSPPGGARQRLGAG